MKHVNKLFLLVWCLLFFCQAHAYEHPSQGGKVYNLNMPSSIMNGDRNYSIYLPEGYELDSLHRYPVLYLLHGLGNTNTAGWVERGNVEHIANKVMAEGKSLPMVIVMPDAGTDGPGYFNRKDWMFEDYFFKELIPYIEQHYRVRKESASRAIAGLSMGGGGTIVYALHHPALFIAACPLSALVTFPAQQANTRQTDDRMNKNPQLRAWAESCLLPENLPLSIVKEATEQQLEAIRRIGWYIDCGDDDYLYEGNLELYKLFRSKNIPMQYRMRDGAHNWLYWQSALPEVLTFVSIRMSNRK